MASLIPLARSFPQRAAVICRGLIHFRCVHSDALRDAAAADGSDASSPSTPSPRGAGRGKRAPPGTDSTAVRPSDVNENSEFQADRPLTTKTSPSSTPSSEGAEHAPLTASATSRKRIGEQKSSVEDVRGAGRGRKAESLAAQLSDFEQKNVETQAERSSAGASAPKPAVAPPKHIGEFKPRTQVHGAGRGRGSLTVNTMGRPLPQDQPSAEPDMKSVDMLISALQKLKPGPSATTVTDPSEPKPGSKPGLTPSAEPKFRTQVPGRSSSAAQPGSSKGQGQLGRAKPRYAPMQKSQTVPLGLRSAPAYEPGIMGTKGPSVPDVAGVSREVSRDVPRGAGAGRGAKMAPGHFAPGPSVGLQSKTGARRGRREREDWVDAGEDGEEDEEVREDWQDDEEGDDQDDGGGPFQSYTGLDPDLYDDIPVLEYEAAARERKVKKLEHPWVEFWGGQVTPPSQIAEFEKAHTVKGQMKWNWILNPPRYDDIDIKSDVDFSHLTNEVDKRHKYYEVFMTMVDTVAGNNSYSIKQKEASIQFMMKAFGMGPKYAHKGKAFIEESSPGPQ